MAVRTGGGSLAGLTAEQQANLLAILHGPQQNGESKPKSSGASTGDPTSAPEVAAEAGLSDEEWALLADIIQLGLDIGGIIEPTPFLDAASGVMSLWRGDWGGALASGVSMFPYVGDLAKAGKLGKYTKSAHRAIKLVADKPNSAFAKAVRPALQGVKDGLDQLPLDRLPDQISGPLTGLRDTLGDVAPKREVFRALREGEDPTQGLRARSPGANTTVDSHVMNKKQSDLISTSKDQSKAEGKFNSGNGVVGIDLDKVTGEVIDASQGVGRGRVFSRTKSDKEVLIRDSGGPYPPIPPEAIRIIQGKK